RGAAPSKCWRFRTDRSARRRRGRWFANQEHSHAPSLARSVQSSILRPVVCRSVCLPPGVLGAQPAQGQRTKQEAKVAKRDVEVTGNEQQVDDDGTKPG